MMLEKQKDYFATRYSLIPDSQLDFESIKGISKETKFMNWLTSFEAEKKKNYIIEEQITLYIVSSYPMTVFS